MSIGWIKKKDLFVNYLKNEKYKYDYEFPY